MTICELCTCSRNSWIVKCSRLPSLETLAGTDSAKFITLDLTDLRDSDDIRLLLIYRPVIVDIFRTVLVPENLFPAKRPVSSTTASSSMSSMSRVFTTIELTSTSVKAVPHTYGSITHSPHTSVFTNHLVYTDDSQPSRHAHGTSRSRVTESTVLYHAEKKSTESTVLYNVEKKSTSEALPTPDFVLGTPPSIPAPANDGPRIPSQASPLPNFDSVSPQPLSGEIIGVISGIVILAILVIVMITMFIAILLITRQRLNNNIRLTHMEMYDL